MFQVVTYAASDMMDPPSQGLSAIVAGTLCFGEGSNLLVKEVIKRVWKSAHRIQTI